MREKDRTPQCGLEVPTCVVTENRSSINNCICFNFRQLENSHFSSLQIYFFKFTFFIENFNIFLNFHIFVISTFLKFQHFLKFPHFWNSEGNFANIQKCINTKPLNFDKTFKFWNIFCFFLLFQILRKFSNFFVFFFWFFKFSKFWGYAEIPYFKNTNLSFFT